MKRTETNKSCWKIIEDTIDTEADHIRIYYGDTPEPVALVAKGEPGIFIVQFLLDAKSKGKKEKAIINEVWEELKFFLVDKGEENPWAYARYHCGTSANVYSNVHWAWFPKGYEGQEGIRSKVIGDMIFKPNI